MPTTDPVFQYVWLIWATLGLPMEELLFGIGFGLYWGSVYEHITWRQRDAMRLRVITANGTYAT